MSFVSNAMIAKIDWISVAVLANTNVLTNITNPIAGAVTATVQPFSWFVCYIAASAAGSLSIKRTSTPQAVTVTETFAPEVINQPGIHTFEVSTFENLNFSYSVNATLLKFAVAEIVPLTFHSSG
jgi:hypothetical protein